MSSLGMEKYICKSLSGETADSGSTEKEYVQCVLLNADLMNIVTQKESF